MPVLSESRSGWRPIAIAAAATMVVTLLLWALSYSAGRTEGWHPPSGARVALMVHLFAAVPALPLGAYVLWRPKGDAQHKLMGRIWAGMMMVTAVSSFWLQSLRGGFSFIHLFAVMTLVAIPLAIWNARRGNVRAHISGMRGVYIGLVVAGVLAAAPDRTLGRLLFG